MKRSPADDRVTTFRIKGWRQIQRYTDRNPTWITVYTTMRDDLDCKAEIAGLDPITDADIGHIVGIFSLAAKHDRPRKDGYEDGPELPFSAVWIQRHAHLTSKPNLKKLVSLGLFECYRDGESLLQVHHRTCTSEQSRAEQSTAEHNTTCGALSAPPVAGVPLNDGSRFDITQADVDRYRELYPAVDVMAELRKLIGWNEANHVRRKTRRGVRQHINGWLSKAQDRAGAVPKGGTVADRNIEALRKVIGNE